MFRPGTPASQAVGPDAKTGRLLSAGSEIPRSAERLGGSRRRQNAPHRCPAGGRGQAHGSRGASRQPRRQKRGVFLAPRGPTAASRLDRGRRRAERAVPDGGSRPSTPAGRPGDALQPARPCGDRRGARPAGPPQCRPGRANFPRENRSSLSSGGAALSPGPTNCSPPPLRSQDPLKIWRPRTSLLGPLRESRNARLQDPRLPVGAKFQLLGPRKERAPLVQREASGTESQSSPSSRSLSGQQFASGEIAK